MKRTASANTAVPAAVRRLRCAVYARKSTEEGLDREFNTLDAQRDACEAYVASQRAEGWVLVPDRYDDGGFSGATLERLALRRLLADIEAGRVDVIVVYKVDRLSRALMDFAKLVEVFDAHGVTFVSVTQSFNTTTSMGRLTLNILLSFAQFEARGDRRAHQGQVRRLSRAGDVDGWPRAARLRRPRPQAGGERGRSGDGPARVRGLCRTRFRDQADPGIARRGRGHQAWQADHQGRRLQAAEQPDLPRRGRA